MDGLIMMLLVASGSAAQVVQDTADVEMAIVAEASDVTLFQPIYIALSFRNLRSEPIRFDLGAQNKETLQISVTPPDGQMRELPKLRTSSGIGGDGLITLRPQETWTTEVLLNEWYVFASPGDYQVQIGSGAAFESVTGDPVRQPSPASVALSILERDETRLRQHCEELTREALSSSDLAEALKAAETLTYVRDPIATPFLGQLVSFGTFLVRRTALEGLGRIATEDAVAILLAQLPIASGEFALYVRRALEVAANNTTVPGLRVRIEEALSDTDTVIR